MSIQNIWDMFWLQITQKHSLAICKIELEGDGESLYRFGIPIPHRDWNFFATRNKNCQLSLQGKKHVVEQQPKTNGRVTLNMDREINYRKPYLFENDGEGIAPCIMRLLISRPSYGSCSRILSDRKKKAMEKDWGSWGENGFKLNLSLKHLTLNWSLWTYFSH